MSTPFDTAPAPVTPATDAQIVRALVPMLAEREWRTAAQPVKFIERAAVLNTTIRWALAPMADATPAEVSRVVNGTVGRLATHGEKVNAILGYLAEGHDGEDDVTLYAPFTKAGASAFISWLTTLPQANRVQLVKDAADSPRTDYFPEVPAGRYAVETNDGAVNDLAFYKVDRPTEGRWSGYVFVKMIVGGGNDVELGTGQSAKAALRKIAAAGAEAAAARYGHELGECGMCGRTLTNDESRARGIGPVCATKAGW